MYLATLLLMFEYKIKNKFLNSIASLFGIYICYVYFDCLFYVYSYYIIFRLEILFRKLLKSEIEWCWKYLLVIGMALNYIQMIRDFWKGIFIIKTVNYFD